MDRHSFTKESYLLEHLKRGSTAAYEHLFTLYHKELCNYLSAITGNPKVAEDIAQQTFIKIWDNREKLQVEDNKLKRYLFKVAYNLFIDVQRKRKKEFMDKHQSRK